MGSGISCTCWRFFCTRRDFMMTPCALWEKKRTKKKEALIELSTVAQTSWCLVVQSECLIFAYRDLFQAVELSWGLDAWVGLHKMKTILMKFEIKLRCFVIFPFITRLNGKTGLEGYIHGLSSSLTLFNTQTQRCPMCGPQITFFVALLWNRGIFINWNILYY